MVIFDTLLVKNLAKERKSPTVMNFQDIKIVRVHVMMSAKYIDYETSLMYIRTCSKLPTCGVLYMCSNTFTSTIILSFLHMRHHKMLNLCPFF